MGEGGSLSKCDNCFKRRSRRAPLSHLIFDLGPSLKFSNPRFQETDRLLHHLTRQNSRSAHLREFCFILAHPQAFYLAQSRDPAHLRAGRLSKTLQLPHRNLGGIEPRATASRILQELAYG